MSKFYTKGDGEGVESGPVAIEIDDDGTQVIDGYTIVPTEDGGVEISETGDDDDMAGAEEHDANLAEFLDDQTLGGVSEDIIEWVETDLQSRAEWVGKLKDGLKKCGIEGLEDTGSGILECQSKVVHPLLMEIAVQFQARAITELFPPQGPVKAVVFGDKTQERESQRQRVEDYMNYQRIVEDRGYFDDTDSMLMYLPFSGSAFRKSWFDPIQKIVKRRYVKAERFVVPYASTSLADAPRYTEIMVMDRNVVRKMQALKAWKNVKLAEPIEGEIPGQDVIDASDAATPAMADGDAPHIFYECHCNLDLDIPGKDPDGVGLPYIVTVERDSRKVVSIRRNWREGDDLKVKRIWYRHYKYLPGLGFYGYGIFHAIGGLGEAATDTLRATLDAASAANFQGGFKSKDISGKDVELEWGVWKDLECTAEDLKNGFFTPPFKGPHEAMFRVLGLLVESGQRFGATTENMVGDAQNTGPVGTTVALIEQGSKVFSAIHKRLHQTAGEEFAFDAELNYDYLPDGAYPYDMRGVDKHVFRKDFDGRVDVVPFSDPNIFSSTQRVAIAQALMQMATQNPAGFRRRKVERYMMEALRVPDPDQFQTNPDSIPPMDPITEGVMALMGRPIRSYEHQHHDAHIMVHMMQAQQMQTTPMGQQYAPSMIAHIQEHAAQKYRLQMMQALRAPLPPITFGESDEVPPTPPEIDAQISMMAAQLAQQAQQQMAQAQGQQESPEAMEQKRKDAVAQAEQARKDKIAQAEQMRKDKIAASEDNRKNQKHISDIRRETMRQRQDFQAKDLERQKSMAQAFLKQKGASDIDPEVFIAAVKESGRNMEATFRLIRKMQAGGQNIPGVNNPIQPGAE